MRQRIPLRLDFYLRQRVGFWPKSEYVGVCPLEKNDTKNAGDSFIKAYGKLLLSAPSVDPIRNLFEDGKQKEMSCLYLN